MLRWFDGFDHTNNGYDGLSGRKYDPGTGAIGTAPGRFEGYCATVGSATNDPLTSLGLYKTLSPGMSTIIIGCAMTFGAGPSIFPFLWIYDGTTPKIKCYLDDTTKVIVIKDGNDVVLANSSFNPPIGLWFYFEIKIVSGNNIIVRINEDEIINTVGAPSASFTKFRFSGLTGLNGNNILLDDLHVLDSTGPAPQNDFIGEVRVQTRYPDAIGSVHDFLPATGANTSSNVAAQVNAPFTDYTEQGIFNYSGLVGGIDLYSIGNFTAAGIVYGVQSNIVFRKDDVGNRKISHMTRLGTSNIESAEQASAFSSYTWFGKIWELNPVTNTAWTIVDLNNAEFGLKIVS